MSNLDTLLKTDPDKNPLRETAAGCTPFAIDPPGAKEAFLLLHGFSGHPGEFRPLAESLAKAGYAVAAPRYPGHGTCRADFLQTTAEDWVRRAFDAYLDLRSKYETVHIAGHSMGGLIATAVATSFGADRLILLAPAFELSIPNIGLIPLIAPFKKVIVRNRQPSALDAGDPVRAQLHRDYWADDFVSLTAELLRLQRSGRKNIGRLKSRTLVITGEKDETVSQNVADWLRKCAQNAASFDARVIAGAGHLFPFDEHAGDMIPLVLEWLKTSR